MASFAERIVVLCAGRVVEQGTLRSVLVTPHHPYTRVLLNCVPELRKGWLEQASSESVQVDRQPDETDTPGCPFYSRCPLEFRDVCDRQPPPLHRLRGDHRIACHRQLTELA